MSQQVTESEVGKKVVYDDNTVGRVVNYKDGTAYVEPDPDILDVVQSKLGWETGSEETFPLQRELVDEITENAIYLGAAQ